MANTQLFPNKRRERSFELKKHKDKKTNQNTIRQPQHHHNIMILSQCIWSLVFFQNYNTKMWLWTSNSG